MTAQMARQMLSAQFARQAYSGKPCDPRPEPNNDPFANYLASNCFQSVPLHHAQHQSVQSELLGAPNPVPRKRARTNHGPGKQPPQAPIMPQGHANTQMYPYRATGKPKHLLEYKPAELQMAIESMAGKHEAMLRRQCMNNDVCEMLRGILVPLDERIVQAEEQLNELQKIRESIQDRLDRYAEEVADTDESTDSSSQEEADEERRDEAEGESM